MVGRKSYIRYVSISKTCGGWQENPKQVVSPRQQCCRLLFGMSDKRGMCFASYAFFALCVLDRSLWEQVQQPAYLMLFKAEKWCINVCANDSRVYQKCNISLFLNETNEQNECNGRGECVVMNGFLNLFTVFFCDLVERFFFFSLSQFITFTNTTEISACIVFFLFSTTKHLFCQKIV